MKTYVDDSLKEQGEHINFNAGLRTHSLRLGWDAYEAVEQPAVTTFRV